MPEAGDLPEQSRPNAYPWSDIPVIVPVNLFSDIRGGLGVVESRQLPFSIERMYFLFDVPIGAVRGEHGHKKLEQFIICMNGACDITLTDGKSSFHFELNSPSQGLLVPPGLWRKLNFREPSTVICVLASAPFDVDDYIYSYEDFLVWRRGIEKDGLKK